jgi:hypothetical protein
MDRCSRNAASHRPIWLDALAVRRPLLDLVEIAMVGEQQRVGLFEALAPGRALPGKKVITVERGLWLGR